MLAESVHLKVVVDKIDKIDVISGRLNVTAESC